MRSLTIPASLFALAILASAPVPAQDKKAEPPSVPGLGDGQLLSGLLTDPIPLGKAKSSLIIIESTGKTGSVLVYFDTNQYTLNAFGDRVPKIEAGISDPQKVTFNLGDVDTADPLKQGRKRYTLVPAAKGEFEGRFALVVPAKISEPHSLLVLDKDGKTTQSVSLYMRTRPLPPCHPGCFPAGTLVLTPNGTKAIETVKVGDVVTTISKAGKPVPGTVAALFRGDSQVVEIETAAGKLICTPKQPFHLTSGATRSAGQLIAGDKLLRWADGKSVPTTVIAMTPLEKPTIIHNLILTEPGTFLANGYLVKSKPPADH